MDLYEFYSGKCFDAYNELGAHVVKENVGKSRRKMVTGVDLSLIHISEPTRRS